jgi:hypothetical protein
MSALKITPRRVAKRNAIKRVKSGRAVASGTEDEEPRGLVGPIPLGSRSVPDDPAATILQISEDLDDERLVARLLIEEFRSAFPKLRDGEEWFAWIGRVDYHPRALNVWVATSSNVPPGLLGGLGDILKVMGFPSVRVTGSTAALSPLLYVGPDGVELLRMI